MEQKNVEELFNDIYDKTYKNCLVYITSKCSNPEDISDILQETYISLYNTIMKKPYHIKNFEAYVIQIAKSKVFKYYSLQQKLKSFIPLFKKNIHEEEYNIYDMNVNIFENQLENSVLMADSLDSISNYLKEKPYDIQKIFILFYYLEMKISDISKTLNLNESTVKTKLYRTTHEIRTLFGKDGINNER